MRSPGEFARWWLGEFRTGRLSQEERDEIRRDVGRQGAQARGMRQAAARDRVAPDNSWHAGPVPEARHARQQQRTRQKFLEGPVPARSRAETLARAMDQSLARDRQDRPVRGRTP